MGIALRVLTPTEPIQRIQVLSPLVANQIAAGEVVERPASVVKELVENSLDAGAQRVTVELEQGGIELIRISDDGRGMSPEDLPLSLAPHATSKIRTAEDLEHIATLGFRGEALASIASVARVQIRSRTASMAGASVIECEGDRVVPIMPAAGPVGTVVTVRTLFFNTPARRKFLRTIGTEQERCADTLRQIALAHPGVAFTLVADGRTTLDVPGNQTARERALAILGKELSAQFLDVHADQFDDSRGVTLWGLAGLPSIARGTSKSQYVFVNGRPVKDRTIQHAIAEAYRGIIDPSRYPTIILMLEMSPSGVDVNVHPAKAEVRFRDSSMVHSVVLRAVRAALASADLTPVLSSLKAGMGGGGSGTVGQGIGAVASELPGSGLLGDVSAGAQVARFVEYFQRPAPQQSGIDYQRMKAGLSAEAAGAGVDGAAGVGQDASVVGAGAGAIGEVVRPDTGRLTEEGVQAERSGRILQVHNSYLVTQDTQGVVIIDQHALHERVMFEYLLERVSKGPLESQRLLVPVAVPATRDQVLRLDELSPLLERIGIQAGSLSPTSVGVHAFPSFLFDRNVDPVEFMQELFEKLDRGLIPTESSNRAVREEALRDVLDMMSCKAAVKAGDRMSDLELGELARLREAVERSSNCPHGRPTSIRLTLTELEKLFGRR
jgi:DNA mismatch repair protein MutL